MKIEEFYTELKKRFTFEKTWAEFAVLKDEEVLVFEDNEGTKYPISHLEYLEANEELHFKVASFMADNGESFFYVSEPGNCQGQVFINYHDEGLYSIENLLDEDELEEVGFFGELAEYKKMSFDDKKEIFQFFENKLANSLEELLAGIKILNKDQL